MEKIKSMPKILKIVLIIVLIIALSGGAAAVYLDSKLDKISFNSGENTPMSKGEAYTEVKDNFELNLDGMEQKDGAAALPEGDAFSDNDVINILLLGTDMPIPGTDDTGRCDMTMLCSLNKKTGDVKLVGFERAIGVPVPKYEDDMLTHVFQYGGGEFMQETINKCFRVDVDAYIHVGYEMFPQVIDAIGGIRNMN